MERQLAQEIALYKKYKLVAKLRPICHVCAFMPKLDIGACMDCTYMAKLVEQAVERLEKLKEAGKNYKMVTDWGCK